MQYKRFLVTFCNNWQKSNINFAEVRVSYSDKTLENVEIEGFSLNIPNVVGATGAISNNDHLIIGLQGAQNDLVYINKEYKVYEQKKIGRMSDIHGIAADNKGIIGVSTGSNCIIREGGELYSFPSPFDPLEMDVEHINDVCWVGNNLIACKFGPKRINGLRNGCVYEVESGNVLFDGLNQPHSVFYYEDQLYVLDSLTGSLILLDSSFGPKVILAIRGYARGLCMNDRILLIGSSRRRVVSRKSAQSVSTMLFADEQQKLALDVPGIHIFDRTIGGNVFVNLEKFTDEVYQIIEIN